MQQESETPADSHVSGSDDPLADLRRSVAVNRLVLLVVTGLITVMLASWLTLGIISYTSEDAPDVLTGQVAALEQRLGQLDDSLQQQKALIEQQQAELTTQNALIARLSAPSPAGSDPALRKQLARSLIGQELGFQQSLLALKSGMRDLAAMIPGSRSWLADYEEALNKPLAESGTRVKELQQWSSEAAATPAP